MLALENLRNDHLQRSLGINPWRLTFFEPKGPVALLCPDSTVVEDVMGPEPERIYMFVAMPIIMPHLLRVPSAHGGRHVERDQ